MKPHFVIVVIVVLNILPQYFGLINFMNGLTCLPCNLQICSGSSSIPASKNVCELANGISIPGPSQRQDCFPAWINLTKFRQGQKFMKDHQGKLAVLETIALLGLLAFPELTDTLLFTATNDCPMQAEKRYPTTTSQILLWATADIGIPGNPCAILNSLNKVRNVHQHAAERVRRVAASSSGPLASVNSARFSNTPVNDAFWNAFKLDLEAAYTPQQLALDPCYTAGQANYVPLNQFGYLTTQWSFSAISSMSKDRALLLGTSDADIDALQHWWSVVGNIMGIEDDYNIALQPNPAARKIMYDNFTTKYVIPALYNRNHESKYAVELTLSRAATVSMEMLGIQLPSPLPVELLGLSFLRLFLNVPYNNTYAVSPPEAQAFVKALDPAIPVAPTLDPELNLVSTSSNTYWGNKYFGVCFNTWQTNCQRAEKLHYLYQGPDINPDGQLSSSQYCPNPNLLSLLTC